MVCLYNHIGTEDCKDITSQKVRIFWKNCAITDHEVLVYYLFCFTRDDLWEIWKQNLEELRPQSELQEKFTDKG